MKKVLILVVAFTLVAAGVAFAGIANTKHNLSSSGTTVYTSSNEDEICVFCHTPHAAVANPLWNRTNPTDTYTHYSSDTFNGGAIALGAGSLNCLSCHDGALGLNVVVNGVGAGTGRAITMTNNRITGTYTNIAGDASQLANDHPVGFVYGTSAGADTDIAPDTTTLGAGWIAKSGATTIAGLMRSTRMECASCHEPHKENTYDSTKVSFLRNANTGSDMCLTCHLK